MRQLRLLAFAALVTCVSSALVVAAIPPPPPVTISFSKTITNMGVTLMVSGNVTIVPANESVSGTVNVKATNATGATIASLSISFSNSGNVSRTFTFNLPVPAANVLLQLTTDTFLKTVTVDWTLLAGAGARRP